MKGFATKLAVFTAATMIFASPVLAEERAIGMGQGQQMQKDECLLVSQNCRESVDSIQQRIDRLNREIGKGGSVYSSEELRHLDFQLRETNQMLNSLIGGGA